MTNYDRMMTDTQTYRQSTKFDEHVQQMMKKKQIAIMYLNKDMFSCNTFRFWPKDADLSPGAHKSICIF